MILLYHYVWGTQNALIFNVFDFHIYKTTGIHSCLFPLHCIYLLVLMLQNCNNWLRCNIIINGKFAVSFILDRFNKFKCLKVLCIIAISHACAGLNMLFMWHSVDANNWFEVTVSICHYSWYTYTHMHARLILTIDPFRLSHCRTVTTNQSWQQSSTTPSKRM